MGPASKVAEDESRVADKATNAASKAIKEDRYPLERQLERSTLDMARMEKVITEMSLSFKHQTQSKELEVSERSQHRLGEEVPGA